MTIFIAAIVGLMLGSFLSVLLVRWPHWRGVVAGRSQCPSCSHALAWYDLIPLASWLWLRGACRSCAERISPLYPILELVMAAVFGVYAYRFGIVSVWSALDLAILFALVALFFFDLRYQILPDAILLPLVGSILISILGQVPGALVGAVVTGAALAAVVLALHIGSGGRWIGLGDAKFAFMIGLLFGYPVALTVTMVAIWLGALVGVGLILLKKATMQTAVPLGAFWAAVAIIAVLIR
jgi:leader peptidase (prepilin peptidase) / N-methyltransferase